jgi:hypothetical protein
MATAEKPASAPSGGAAVLEQGTYEVIRNRLAAHGADLQARLDRLNEARQEVFGTIHTELLETDRIATRNKCIPRDMVAIGKQRFIFGYNVQIGLRSQTTPADVFALYELRGHEFHELPLETLALAPDFEGQFGELYRYFRQTTFARFFQMGPHLYMVFEVGKTHEDIKTFKWLIEETGLKYLGNRSDHEVRYPAQHEFEWIRTHRELHRFGLHPHISIEDRLFVETVGGDLTVKVEDNTASGQGIYGEPVENADQTLDDAEVFYAIVGSLILLKIRPYQEKNFRYLVFNEKLQQVRRIDAIGEACVLLPDGQGILFPNGYYLQTGEFRAFEIGLSGVKFDSRLQSPNGEDHLFRFYNEDNGSHLLLSYNVIEQQVKTPIVCGGCSLFDNGELVLFKNDPEPQKHHTIQIWQTPFVAGTHTPALKRESFLFKIGNADLVSAMAECREILALLGKDDTYSNLYFDLVKKTGDILDLYFWIGNEEAGNLQIPLQEIRAAATGALDEFEKVVQIRRSTAEQVRTITEKARQLIANIPFSRLNEIGQFVQNLSALRSVRGELISLKELRYADLPTIDAVEKDVAENVVKLSGLTVQFLLTDGALDPYRRRSEELQAGIPGLGKVTEVRRVDEEANVLAKDLEMLIEVVSNLKIEDATQTTRIIESISAVYSVLNQARASLKQKNKDLRKVEAVAEFASQSRLLQQALTNYLDLSQTAAKCDEYLTKLMVQIEELEARFADFEDFILQLSEKRTELSSAFESRKLELVEAVNRKTTGLLNAAERILKGIKHRADPMKSADEINGYFASDVLVDKVRDVVRQLIDLGDTVKADDLQSRLKTIREDALRQLRDRQELFVDGQNLIQLGNHRFSVNTQELGLTMVQRNGDMWLHLAGTRFFEKIEEPDLLATRPVWDQEVISENSQVYRGEYLAYQVLRDLENHGRIEEAAKWTDAERLAVVQEFLGPRYAEGYTKGVHDHDASRILGALLAMQLTIGLLRYPTQARACALAFWYQYPDGPPKELLLGKVRGFGAMNKLFPNSQSQPAYIKELRDLIQQFVRATGLFEEQWCADAAEYLYHEIKRGSEFVIAPEAAEWYSDFQTHLSTRRFQEAFAAARSAVQGHFASTVELLRDWMRGFITSSTRPEQIEYLDEATLLLWRDECPRHAIVKASITQRLEKMAGNHPVLSDGAFELHYIRFTQKLAEFEGNTVPLFQRCQALKKLTLTRQTEELRLESFKPRVLTSFVRNRLIDSVYLPLIGNNLAKQIGVAGENKRTDLMGMLLLISPPGYGKTTLLEYVAHRLGLVFVKINGPALGSKVVSLDPAEAPNAAAREEVEKLNFAFEMGDNVMICLDDIQHCQPEFLQKFISLCDAQRKIEGVYRGQSRTYDLRGRKVAIAMAGNPYTESGDKFQIPDMLANRADTYNLGDVIGNNAEAFNLSYLENAMTSNPVLSRIASRHPSDIYPVIQLAQTGSRDGLDFQGGYSAEELNQLVTVMRHLLRVRDVILKVNAAYIASAAQAEAYRTEPPFKLQGSYRNMNRLAERILPVMNVAEVDDLIAQHYKDEAQTLTKGTEANLLKFKELVGRLTPAENRRWEDIKRTFKKNLLFRSGDGQDPIALVVGQLAAFNEGLESIKDVLARPPAPPSKSVTVLLMPNHPAPTAPPTPPSATAKVLPPSATEEGLREVSITPETLKKIWDLVAQQNNSKTSNVADQPSPPREQGPS